eukprot:11203275-Lingulodinium_polyedra.AAC.1
MSATKIFSACVMWPAQIAGFGSAGRGAPPAMLAAACPTLAGGVGPMDAREREVQDGGRLQPAYCLSRS